MEYKATNKLQPTERDAIAGHAGFKYLGMMLICCLVPLAAAFTLKQLGYSGIASYLMLLLCPIMHLLMMRGMLKNQAEPQTKIKGQNMQEG